MLLYYMSINFREPYGREEKKTKLGIWLQRKLSGKHEQFPKQQPTEALPPGQRDPQEGERRVPREQGRRQGGLCDRAQN